MKLSITIPLLCGAYARKRFFGLMSFLWLCIFTLSSCVPREASIDYSNRQLILILPIVNRLDKEKLPDQYYDERRSFRVGYFNSFRDDGWNEFSKGGYDVVHATEAYTNLDTVISKGLFVSPQLLDSIVSGSHSGSIAPSEYAYVIVMSIDSIKRVELQTGREAHVSVFLINNRDGSLYWSNEAIAGWAVMDPADLTEAAIDTAIIVAREAIAPTEGEDSKSMRTAIGDAFGKAMSKCPLLSTR